MVQSIINISSDTNMVLNVIKAKYGLKDKSQAINVMAEQYKEKLLEPQYKPEFLAKIKKIEKEKGIKVKSFAKRYGLSD